MGTVIPADFGVLAFHTQTLTDPEDMIWTLGVGLGSANSIPDVPAMASALWDEHIGPITSTVVTLVLTELKVGPTSTGPTFVDATNHDGQDGGVLPPPNCAVLVAKRSTLGGRKGRGRMYLPGISSFSASLNSGGVFFASDADDITGRVSAFASDLQTDTDAGPVIPVVLHSDATAPSTIVTYTASNRLATQRRRLRP